MTMATMHKLTINPLRHSLQRLLTLCRPLCLALPLWAATCGVASAESWKVNLQDADIKAFINEVATITDQTSFSIRVSMVTSPSSLTAPYHVMRSTSCF